MATNRLIHEDSSYLKQHAHNPVDWYPWCDEAFAEAVRRDAPIFLSIGYSTCHWCHVMERETFADEEVADFLNQHFVSIKLDREQRPDLDELYMTALQLMGLQGGWPMSMFVTSKAEPFFGGTYFPADQFLERLQQIQSVWQHRRDDVEQQATELAQNINQINHSKPSSTVIGQQTIQDAIDSLMTRFDPNNGGFSHQPKFPMEPQLLMLLDCLRRKQDDVVADALHLTLKKMVSGGLFDHVAGGFHRYSVDAEWQIPHFEKMLYNQALLTQVYAEASELFGDVNFRLIAERTANYVLRDMKSPEGRFYSATDADSEGREGTFFVWSLEQIEQSLSQQEFELLQMRYDVSEQGNFEGSTVLTTKQSLESLAQQQSTTIEALRARLDDIHLKLYQVRERRIKPLRDEKFIASWNGMMISALISLGNDAEAEQAGQSIWNHQVRDGELFRIGFGERRATPGTLEDYACVAEAFLQLHLVSENSIWLSRAFELLATMNQLFWDDREGGYFISRSNSDGPLISQSKNPKDTAILSANGIALKVLLMAHEASGDLMFRQRANEMIEAFSNPINEAPIMHSSMLAAFNRLEQGSVSKIQFASDGNIRVQRVGSGDEVQLLFTLKPGWHINADQVSEDRLVPTVVEGGIAHFPQPTLIRVAYQTALLPVFQNSFTVTIKKPQLHVVVTLQPCNNEICLKPQTLTFYVPK